ncbi:MAG: nucleoside phosphorylase [Saprospiraceae bacterium]|nr:nucleoside phosphorylase [Saprospiraceae bacterium]
MKLQASELILNPDGSIYHLHLLPEQLAPIILTVGDQDRVDLVSRYFDRVEYRVRKREFVTHTGWLGNTRLSVVSTGIGPDNIDIVLNEIDALFNIDLDTRTAKPHPTALTIIRLGTAGGLQPEVPVDSLVVSAGGIGMDGLLQFYEAPAQQRQPLLDALRQHFAGEWSFPLAPYYAAADPGLLAKFQAGLYSGYTATNPGFYGPQGRQLRAPVRMPGYLDQLQTFSFEGQRVLNLEMETAAIYGLAQLLGHKALSVSAILANRPLGQFSRDSDALLQRLIETCLEKIEAGL